jgi:hypothetical protein
MTEKEQCLKLIDNLLKVHKQDTPKVLTMLKELRKKVRLIGINGGPSLAQPAQHSNNSIDANQHQQCA